MRPRATFSFFIFSRDAATLYERVSVRPSVGWSVGHAFVFWPPRSDLWPCIGPCLYLYLHGRGEALFGLSLLLYLRCNLLDYFVVRIHGDDPLAKTLLEINTGGTAFES